MSTVDVYGNEVLLTVEEVGGAVSLVLNIAYYLISRCAAANLRASGCPFGAYTTDGLYRALASCRNVSNTRARPGAALVCLT